MAAESTVPKGAVSGAVTLLDGTGTPVSLAALYSHGDLAGTNLSGKLNEVTPVESRGNLHGLIHGARRYPEVSFTVYANNIVGSSASAPGTPYEFVNQIGAYSANISTSGAGRPYTVDVRLTIEGTDQGDTADETITFEDCRVTPSFNEAMDGNTIAFSATCYGNVVHGNSANTPSLTEI